MVNYRRARQLGRGLLLLAGVGALANGCRRGPGEDGEGASTFQGVVEFEEVALAFELSGRLREVGVARGQRVDAGTPLATLDTTVAELTREARAREAEAHGAQASLVEAGARPQDVRAVEAQLQSARAQEVSLERSLRRQRPLVEQGAVAPATLDGLEAQLARAQGERESLEERLTLLRAGARSQEKDAASARAAAAVAAVSLAQAQLERHRLMAPLAATVLEVHLEPGEVALPGAPVVTLADTARPYADVFVPQGQLSGIAVGGHATVQVDAEAQAFEGKVEEVGRRAEFTPRYLFSERERPNLVHRVRVRIQDPEQRLHAGVPAQVRFTRGGAP